MFYWKKGGPTQIRPYGIKLRMSHPLELNVFLKGPFHFQHGVCKPVKLFVPFAMVFKLSSPGGDNLAGLAPLQLVPGEGDSGFPVDLSFVTFQGLIQLLIIRDIKGHVQLVSVSDLGNGNIALRGTDRIVHPMVRRGFSPLELPEKLRVLKGAVLKRRPIIIPALLGLAGKIDLFNLLGPVVGLFKHIEFDGRFRLADAVELDFSQEKGL